ncbi:MAG: helix-turn-helix transcriptional regulator [Bacteroidota bacterium]
MTTPAFSLAAIPLLLSALLGVGVGIALLRTDRGLRAARRCLAALSLVLAVLLGSMAIRFSGMAGLPPVLSAFVNVLWLAIAPLFYGYVRALLPGRARWSPEDLVHAIPVLYQTVLTLAFLLAPALADAVTGPVRLALATVFLTLYCLQTMVYAGATARMVTGYARRYRREAAGGAVDQVIGLQRLVLLFGAYAGALVINTGMFYATGGFIDWLDYLVPLGLAVIVSAVGVGLLRRPRRVLPDLRLTEAEPEAEPIAASRAPLPDLEPHAAALREVLETERPYLDPEVRLGDLAARVGISERTLSQVLAEAFGGSFYDVVNGYRVREVQARLADPAHAPLTVLAVGLDSGFSSKASFNRVFKQRTGETPSAYRARALATPREVLGPSGDGAMREAQPVI